MLPRALLRCRKNQLSKLRGATKPTCPPHTWRAACLQPAGFQAHAAAHAGRRRLEGGGSAHSTPHRWWVQGHGAVAAGCVSQSAALRLRLLCKARGSMCRPAASLAAACWPSVPTCSPRAASGSVNYVAVSEALSLSPSARMAGLAADDLVGAPCLLCCACGGGAQLHGGLLVGAVGLVGGLRSSRTHAPAPAPKCKVQIVSAYFLTLYALAKRVPPDAPSTPSFDERAEAAPAPAAGGWDASLPAAAAAGATGAAAAQQAAAGRPPSGQQHVQQQAQQQAAQMQPQQGAGEEDTRTITVLHGATALAVAAAICFAGTQIAAALRYKGGSITVITGITGEWRRLAGRRVWHLHVCTAFCALLSLSKAPVPCSTLAAVYCRHPDATLLNPLLRSHAGDAVPSRPGAAARIRRGVGCHPYAGALQGLGQQRLQAGAEQRAAGCFRRAAACNQLRFSIRPLFARLMLPRSTSALAAAAVLRVSGRQRQHRHCHAHSARIVSVVGNRCLM